MIHAGQVIPLYTPVSLIAPVKPKRMCTGGKRHKWSLVRSATRPHMCDTCGWWPSRVDQPRIRMRSNVKKTVR